MRKGYRKKDALLTDLTFDGDYDTLDSAIWKTDQAWHRTRLERFYTTYVDGPRERQVNALYRYEVVRDAYQQQSYAKMERWDGEQWRLAYYLDGYRMTNWKPCNPAWDITPAHAASLLQENISNCLRMIAWELEAHCG